MAQSSPIPSRSNSAAGAAVAPSVRLDVRLSSAAPTSYSVDEQGFLLGSVPGCDLRLSGANLPPVLALITRQGATVSLRKLAPVGHLLLNGQPVSQSALNNNDRLTIGTTEIVVRLTGNVPVMRVQLFNAEENAQQSQQLRDRERAIEAAKTELATIREELAGREAELLRQQQELDRVREEMKEIRLQLYERYRRRRDRLAGLQAAVRKAAKRVQDRKREFEFEVEQATSRRVQSSGPQSELTTLAEEVARKAELLQQHQRAFAEKQQQVRNELERQRADLIARESRLAEEKQTLERNQTQHQNDLVRLDRLAATLEQRQKQLQKQAIEVDKRFEEMQRESREIEEQAQELDEWRTRLEAQAAQTETTRKETEQARQELAQRAAAIEGQQAMLATLRSRLERMREEHRREEQQLSEQRARQEEIESEIETRLMEARRVSQETAGDRKLHDEQQRQFRERQASLDAAVAQIRQAHTALEAEATALDQRQKELDATAVDLQEQAALLQSRRLKLDADLQRVDADRQALAERDITQRQAEQALSTLQEQLRRRAEELSTRQRAQDEQVRQLETQKSVAQQEHDARLAQLQQQADELQSLRQGVETRGQELLAKQAEMEQQRQELHEQTQSFGTSLANLEQDRAELRAAQLAFETHQQTTRETTEVLQQEVARLREEMLAVQQRFPEQIQQAEGALERLNQAREQLREHLAEIHGYARQTRDDVAQLERQLQTEREQLRQREATLYQTQDEHRLAVAAFRQQLLDWQTQLAELRSSVAQDESRLERKQAEVQQRAEEIANATQRLAEQQEQLQQQQRVVLERRQVIDGHLTDMQEWYRRKMRELAQSQGETLPPEEPERAGILSMTEEIEPGDRQLGELLHTLELIDGGTLQTLLAEARRQRRSLRQLLLAGNYLTLYQMALIEAGNLAALVLGPVRVIDRMQATNREAAYRVFDPRHNREVLLRHLAEAEMEHEVRPDEFRQRFAALAEVQHPNLSATLEVLEIAGRPAVLQEWLSGVPSTEWPAYSAVAGVWYRLVSQAALGLQTLHQQGLTHGQLHSGVVICTPAGVVKLSGAAEPPWLAVPPREIDESSVVGDLRALGEMIAAWSQPVSEQRGPKVKPLPTELQAIVQRLRGQEGVTPFTTTSELLEELDRAGASIPANATAWERFLKAIQEHSTTTPVRRSA